MAAPCFLYRWVVRGGLEFGEGMLAPVEDEQEAEEHAAEVGKMGDAVGNKDALEELDGGIAYDEPLGFDGHEEVEIDALFWKHHAEGQEDAVDSARSAHGESPAGDEYVAEAGAYAADEVVEQKAPRTPEVF